MEAKKETAMGMNKANMGAGLLVGFVTGAAIGLGAGLLFAPKTGRETREMLRARAMKVGVAASGAAGRVKQGAQQVGQVAQETAHGVKEEIQAKMQ